MLQKVEKFINEYANKRVLVWGIGLNGGGVGVAKFFAEIGATVRAIDTKSSEELKESLEILEQFPNIDLLLGQHRLEDFAWADIIIKNPAVKPNNEFLVWCESEQKEIITEMTLFLRLFRDQVIGITGTRGKSTTTALIYKALADFGLKVVTGGNNKTPLLSVMSSLNNESIVVAEISSYMGYDLLKHQVSPHVSVITNIYQDHLDWHPDMRHYLDSKLALFRFQNDNDLAFINSSDSLVREEFTRVGQGKKILVCTDPADASFPLSWDFVNSIRNESLEGKHNISNIAIAWSVVKQFGVTEESFLRTVNSYEGLEFRQQNVGSYRNVIFINDSASTMYAATRVCVERFYRKGRIHLIIGGVDKNQPLTEVYECLKLVDSITFLVGSLYDKLRGAGLEEFKAKINGVFDDLKEALRTSFDVALHGNTHETHYVIFSPSAASFNMFKNATDRGKQFNELVKELVNSQE